MVTKWCYSVIQKYNHLMCSWAFQAIKIMEISNPEAPPMTQITTHMRSWSDRRVSHIVAKRRQIQPRRHQIIINKLRRMANFSNSMPRNAWRVKRSGVVKTSSIWISCPSRIKRLYSFPVKKGRLMGYRLEPPNLRLKWRSLSGWDVKTKD